MLAFSVSSSLFALLKWGMELVDSKEMCTRFRFQAAAIKIENAH